MINTNPVSLPKAIANTVCRDTTQTGGANAVSTND